jgi:hypothetical protein
MTNFESKVNQVIMENIASSFKYRFSMAYGKLIGKRSPFKPEPEGLDGDQRFLP